MFIGIFSFFNVGWGVFRGDWYLKGRVFSWVGCFRRGRVFSRDGVSGR